MAGGGMGGLFGNVPALGAVLSCFGPPPPPVLVRLEVTGATRLPGNHWWTVVDPAANVTVRARTKPDNAGVWAQIAWGGQGVAAAAANLKTVPRNAVAINTNVNAQLNSPLQTVLIDVYDLTALVCDLPLDQNMVNGLHQWKGYAGYVLPGNTTTATATTNPPLPGVWNKLRWSGGNAGAALNQRVFSTTTARDEVVVVTLASLSQSIRLHICQWPVLEVQEVDFSGGHQIDIDETDGVFHDHWIRGRRQDRQSRLCYTKNTNVTLTATLRVTTHPTDQETVQVRATATFNPTGGAPVQIRWVSGNIVVQPADAQVSFPAPVAGNNHIPDYVEFYDGKDITWEMSTPTGGWAPIGTTRHVFYVILANPVAGATVYWTPLHYSCLNARGDATAAALVPHVFNAFRGLNPGIRRMRDNKKLTYWNPESKAGSVSDTQLLMASPSGAGHCGSWASLLITMHNIHGINTADKVFVSTAAYRNHATGLPPGGPIYQFLVQNWQFLHPPASANNALTHRLRHNCVKRPGIPGQNNPNPPPMFLNHFVVRSRTDNRIYDPSYGADFAGQNAWEAGAIHGLCDSSAPSPNAGFDTTLAPGRLLEMYDMTADAVIP